MREARCDYPTGDCVLRPPAPAGADTYCSYPGSDCVQADEIRAACRAELAAPPDACQVCGAPVDVVEIVGVGGQAFRLCTPPWKMLLGLRTAATPRDHAGGEGTA